MMGLRDKIKAANDRPIIRLHVPEWDCDVWLRAMSGSQRDIFEMAWAKRNEEGADEQRARLAAMVLCEEDGQPVYDDFGVGVNELKQKSAAALDRIFDAVLDQNKIAATGGIDAVAAATAKNSESAQPGS